MDEDLLIATAVLFATEAPRTKRTKWVKNLHAKRNRFSHTNLMEELRLEPTDWLIYARMDERTYLMLLQWVTPLIRKQTTKFREPVSAHERLSTTLRFLISGSSYQNLRFETAISQPLLSEIIPETCQAIMNVLKSYMKVNLRNTMM